MRHTEFSHIVISELVFLLVFVLASLFLLMTILSRSPINVILFLIAFFCNIAALFIYCGVDYLAVLILVLYAGAISIVLLFVVMLLDMKDLILQREKIARPLYFISISFVSVFVARAVYTSYYSISHYVPRNLLTVWINLLHEQTNIEVVGLVLFKYYVFQFIVMGIFLFLITVLIISLVASHNLTSKRQNLSEQLKKKDSVTFFGK